MLFPAEARIAIENTETDSTMLRSSASSKGKNGNLKEDDQNESPSVRTRELQLRLQALVETGMSKSFFN